MQIKIFINLTLLMSESLILNIENAYRLTNGLRNCEEKY